MNYVIAFFASFVYVFLRATQQLNVIHGDYLWIMPVSIAMSACDVTVIMLILKREKKHKKSLPLILAIGSGGGLGAMVAMWLHQFIV